MAQNQSVDGNLSSEEYIYIYIYISELAFGLCFFRASTCVLFGLLDSFSISIRATVFRRA